MTIACTSAYWGNLAPRHGGLWMGEADATMHDIVTQVQQVSDAVMQLDQVTQQNAALEEESTSAADSLNQQAQQLVKAVVVFRLTA